MAASTLSSFSPIPVRTSTVIHGYASWNMSKTCATLSYSAPANGTHIEIVTGACEASGLVSIGDGVASFSVPAVQAPATSPNSASMTTIERLIATPSVPRVRVRI